LGRVGKTNSLFYSNKLHDISADPRRIYRAEISHYNS